MPGRQTDSLLAELEGHAASVYTAPTALDRSTFDTSYESSKTSPITLDQWVFIQFMLYSQSAFPSSPSPRKVDAVPRPLFLPATSEPTTCRSTQYNAPRSHPSSNSHATGAAFTPAHIDAPWLNHEETVSLLPKTLLTSTAVGLTTEESSQYGDELWDDDEALRAADETERDYVNRTFKDTLTLSTHQKDHTTSSSLPFQSLLLLRRSFNNERWPNYRRSIPVDRSSCLPRTLVGH